MITLLVLLISAGCTSSEKLTETESHTLNDASTVFTENSLTNAPEDNIEEQDTEVQNMSSQIVGTWEIQTANQQLLYWFHNDGTLTGGSEWDSPQITGTWKTSVFGNSITINAVGTNSTGEKISYNMVLTYDFTNDIFSVDNPDEYKNWKFVRAT